MIHAWQTSQSAFFHLVAKLIWIAFGIGAIVLVVCAMAGLVELMNENERKNH